jgi:hypothetical protein
VHAWIYRANRKRGTRMIECCKCTVVGWLLINSDGKEKEGTTRTKKN